MIDLVAIDPGCRRKGCAAALFEGPRLRGFGTLRSTDPPELAPWAGVSVVVERPQIDGRSRTIAPTLLELAWEGAIVAARIAAPGVPIAVSPSEWKGAQHKPQHHARLWGTLDELERAILGGDATRDRIAEAMRRGGLERWAKPGGAYYGAWTMADTLDAVALGVWHLAREGRR